MADAVVIGAGPNGLVAANKLADAGWDVIVLEAQPEPGGAVRSAPLTLPGFTHDRFSAFYPLGVGSPHIASLRLEEHGLRWRAAPVVVADPLEDGTAAIMSRDLEETCASVEAARPGRRRRLARAHRLVGRRRPAVHRRAAWTRSRPSATAPGSRWPWAARAACSTSPASACSPCAASRSSGSAATRPRALLAGNALHPDISAGHAGRRAVRDDAGRPRPAARLAGAGGRRRAAHRGARRPLAEQGRPRRVRRARGAHRRARAAARSACAPPTGARRRPAGRCSPTPARRSSTSSCSSASTCPRASSTESAASSTTRGR